MMNKYFVGQWIRIDEMVGEPNYNGLDGIIESIDDAGQLKGGWGALAVIPGVDKITILKDLPVNEVYKLIKLSGLDEDLVVVKLIEDKIKVDAKKVNDSLFTRVCTVLNRAYNIKVNNELKQITINTGGGYYGLQIICQSFKQSGLL